ncbi:hypothetical protein TELCIR_22195, partial [Teladorsagia circumcincta]
RLAPYKRLRGGVQFVDQIPRTSTGSLDHGNEVRGWERVNFNNYPDVEGGGGEKKSYFRNGEEAMAGPIWKPFPSH